MIKRRNFIRYAGTGLLAAATAGLSSNWQKGHAQTGGSLALQWFGHTCFLFTGDGQRVLVNPFRPAGCTAGYRSPSVEANLVLVSSLLLDEGSTSGLPGNPRLLYEPGVYQLEGKQIQGLQLLHDREGGRRFGFNVAWKWTQGGINILHLGGAAGPIGIEQQILMGRPDLLLLPVGGGPKAYTAQEALQAMRTLNPKMVIPTHYRTAAADANACDLTVLDEFISLVGNSSVQRINSSIMTISTADVPASGPVIYVLNSP